MKRNHSSLSKFATLLFFIVTTLPACPSAAGSGVTYQGRILKPNGEPLNGSNVQFKIQIRTPGSQNCLMYEETKSLDMRASKGLFSLTLNDGTGVRTDSSGFGLDRIFANTGKFDFDPSKCSLDDEYTPSPGDGRKLFVEFKDETMSTWEPMLPTNINYVPFAFDAKQIQGFSPSSIVRVQDPDGTLGNFAPLSNANYNDLLNVIAGTSPYYVRTSTGAGARVPVVSGSPLSAVSGSIWFDSVDSKLKYHDGSTAIPVGAGGGSGTVMSVTAGTGLATTPGTGITTSGSIAIAAGGVVTTLLANGAVTFEKIQNLSANNLILGRSSSGAGSVEEIAIGSGLNLSGGVLTATHKWVEGTGGAIYYNGGYVGIGTASPLGILDINTSATVFPPRISHTANSTIGPKLFFIKNRASNSGPQTGDELASLQAGGLIDSSSSTQSPFVTVEATETWSDPSAGSRLKFSTTPNGSGASQVRMTVDQNGYVGIGTASPTYLLDVKGDALINGMRVGLGGGNRSGNTAIGLGALSANTVGISNVAIGGNALAFNSSGVENVALGGMALVANTTGSNNVAVGQAAGSSITTGQNGTFVGVLAGTNTRGSGNTAVGAAALHAAFGSASSSNVAIGENAGYDVTTGSRNIFIGTYTTGNGITSGNNNVMIGYDVRPVSVTASNQLNVGNLLYASNLASGTTVSSGNVGVGIKSPTGRIHIAASAGTPGTAPLKLTAGTSLASPEAGAIEFDGTNLFYTNALNQRQTLSTAAGSSTPAGASGQIQFNNAGAMGGSTGLTWVAASRTLNLVDGTGFNLSVAPTFINIGSGGDESSRINYSSLIFQDLGTPSNTMEFGAHGLSSTGEFRINAGGSRRMTLDASSGNVGIGVATPATKLQVDGEISPAADNAYPLGHSTRRFTAVYATNGTIQTSDARLKREIENSNLGLDFIARLRPVSYKWNSGRDKDVHYGFLAQEVESAIRDQTQTDNAIVSRDPDSDRYGLRYSELISPIVKAIQEFRFEFVRANDKTKEDIEALRRLNAELREEVRALQRLIRSEGGACAR